MIGLNFKNFDDAFHVHNLHDKLQQVLVYFLKDASEAWPDTTWVVTSVYRKDGGVHQYYRGIDLVPESRQEEIMRMMRLRINETFDYGKEGIEVCPDIHHGTAPHNHLQARDSTQRKEKARV